MTVEIDVLVESLRAVSGHAAGIGNALLAGQVTPERLREYADLLSDLANLMREHADLEVSAPLSDDAA